MTLSDWFINIGIKVNPWLTPIVFFIGLAVCARTYWMSKKPGYLVIAAFFLFAICVQNLLPMINNARYQAWKKPQKLSHETQRAFMKEYVALEEKYYPSGSPPDSIHIAFPFGPILLVTGVWMIGRREPRKNTEPSAPPKPTP